MWNYQAAAGGPPPFPHTLGPPVPPAGRPPSAPLGQAAPPYMAQPPQFFQPEHAGMQQGSVNYNPQPLNIPGMQAAWNPPPQSNQTNHAQMRPPFLPMHGGGFNTPMPMRVSGSQFQFQVPNHPIAPPHTPTTTQSPMFHSDRRPSASSVHTFSSESGAGTKRDPGEQEGELQRWLVEWRERWCPAGMARANETESGGNMTEEQLLQCPVPAGHTVLALYRDMRAQKEQLAAMGPDRQIEPPRLEQIRLLQVRLDEAMAQLRIQLASYKSRKQLKKAYRRRARLKRAEEREGEEARLQRAHARADEWLATRRHLMAETAKAEEERQLARVRSKHVGRIGDELGAWAQMLDLLLQLRQARHTDALRQGYVPSSAEEDSAFHRGFQHAQNILAQAQTITGAELERLNAERDQQDKKIKEMNDEMQEGKEHTRYDNDNFGCSSEREETVSSEGEGEASNGVGGKRGEKGTGHADGVQTTGGDDRLNGAVSVGGTKDNGQAVMDADTMDEYQLYWRQAELSAEGLENVRSSWAPYRVPDGQTPVLTDSIDLVEMLEPVPASNESWAPYLKVFDLGGCGGW